MMPKPKTLTFGDNRPAPATMPKTLRASDDKPRRRLNEDCTFPHIETYRQTNGPLYLSRFKYNKVWFTGIADSEAQAIDNAQQFYMAETKQGREESEMV